MILHTQTYKMPLKLYLEGNVKHLDACVRTEKRLKVYELSNDPF